MSDNLKRARADGVGASDEAVDRAELNSLLAAFKEEVGEITRTQVERSASAVTASVTASINSSMSRLITTYDAGIQKKLDTVDKSLTDLRTRTTGIEQSNKELFAKCAAIHAQMSVLENALAVAEADTPHHQHDPSWDRMPDGTIIRLRSAEPILKSEALQAIDGWFTEFKHQSSVIGDDSAKSKSYVIKFTGPNGLAKAHAQKALAKLRGPDRQWIQFSAQVQVPPGLGLDGSSLKSVRVTLG